VFCSVSERVLGVARGSCGVLPDSLSPGKSRIVCESRFSAFAPEAAGKVSILGKKQAIALLRQAHESSRKRTKIHNSRYCTGLDLDPYPGGEEVLLRGALGALRCV